jgi:hypothetical protein
MNKIVKYKTNYIKYGEVIVKGPCKYEDKFDRSASESATIVDALNSGLVVGERLHVLKSEFICFIPSRKKKPSDTKCYKWMLDNGWKQKSNWKDIQKAYQWVFNNQNYCEFSDYYGPPVGAFMFSFTPDRDLWYSICY